MRGKNNEFPERFFENNGLRVVNHIGYAPEGKKTFLPNYASEFPKRAVSVINAILGLFAVFYNIVWYFGFDYSPFSVFAVILFSVAVFSTIFIISKKALLFLPIIFIIFYFLLKLNYETLLNGIAICANDVGKVIPTGTAYRVDSQIDKYESVQTLINYALFFYGFAICLFSVLRHNFICGFLITSPALAIGVIFELDFSYSAVTALAVYWFVLLAMEIAGFYSFAGARGVKADFIRVKDRFYAMPTVKVQTMARTGILSAVAVTLVITLTLGVMNATGYERPESVKLKRAGIISAAEQFDFKDLSGSFERLSKAFLGGKISGKPQEIRQGGKLGESGSIRFNGDDIMEITATEFRKPIYLRGYTSAIYKDNEWFELPKKTYAEYSEIFDSFAPPGEMPNPLFWYEEYMSAKIKRNAAMNVPWSTRDVAYTTSSALKISMLTDTNYTSYVPALFSIGGGGAYGHSTFFPIKEKTVQSTTKNSFFVGSYDYDNSWVDSSALDPRSFYVPKNDPPRFYIEENTGTIVTTNLSIDDELKSYLNPAFSLDSILGGANSDGNTDFILKTDDSFKELRKAHKIYSQFVYSEYLQLPETPAMDIIADYAAIESLASEYAGGGNSLKKTLDAIRDTIQKDTHYSLDAGKTPQNEDFVKYFLIDNQKGSCTYYASAGVLLCRMAGIPARYCEGYVIMPKDYRFGTPAEQYSFDYEYRTFKVKDTRAHAWAEIYVAGQGWIPYEFTAGYDDGEIYAENPPNKITEPSKSSTSKTDATTSANTTNVLSTPATQSLSQQSDSAATSNFAAKTAQNDIKGKGKLIAVLLIIAALTVPTAGVLLRRYELIKKRRNFSRAPNGEAIAAYGAITEILEYIGKPRGNMGYLEYAEYVEKETTFFSENDFVQATDFALKAKFSREELPQSQQNELKNLYRALTKKIFETSKPLTKIGIWAEGFSARY